MKNSIHLITYALFLLLSCKSMRNESINQRAPHPSSRSVAHDVERLLTADELQDTPYATHATLLEFGEGKVSWGLGQYSTKNTVKIGQYQNARQRVYEFLNRPPSGRTDYLSHKDNSQIRPDTHDALGLLKILAYEPVLPSFTKSTNLGDGSQLKQGEFIKFLQKGDQLIGLDVHQPLKLDELVSEVKAGQKPLYLHIEDENTKDELLSRLKTDPTLDVSLLSHIKEEGFFLLASSKAKSPNFFGGLKLWNDIAGQLGLPQATLEDHVAALAQIEDPIEQRLALLLGPHNFIFAPENAAFEPSKGEKPKSAREIIQGRKVQTTFLSAPLTSGISAKDQTAFHIFSFTLAQERRPYDEAGFLAFYQVKSESSQIEWAIASSHPVLFGIASKESPLAVKEELILDDKNLDGTMYRVQSIVTGKARSNKGRLVALHTDLLLNGSRGLSQMKVAETDVFFKDIEEQKLYSPAMGVVLTRANTLHNLLFSLPDPKARTAYDHVLDALLQSTDAVNLAVTGAAEKIGNHLSPEEIGRLVAILRMNNLDRQRQRLVQLEVDFKKRTGKNYKAFFNHLETLLSPPPELLASILMPPADVVLAYFSLYAKGRHDIERYLVGLSQEGLLLDKALLDKHEAEQWRWRTSPKIKEGATNIDQFESMSPEIFLQTFEDNKYPPVISYSQAVIKVKQKVYRFPDCAETSLRNLVLHSLWKDKKYDTSQFPLMDPRLKSYLETYAKAPDGEARSAWATLMMEVGNQYQKIFPQYNFFLRKSSQDLAQRDFELNPTPLTLAIVLDGLLTGGSHITELLQENNLHAKPLLESLYQQDFGNINDFENSTLTIDFASNIRLRWTITANVHSEVVARILTVNQLISYKRDPQYTQVLLAKGLMRSATILNANDSFAQSIRATNLAFLDFLYAVQKMPSAQFRLKALALKVTDQDFNLLEKVIDMVSFRNESPNDFLKDLVDKIIDKNSSPDRITLSNLLKVAVKYGHLEVVKDLIVKGAKVKDEGFDIIVFAAEYGHLEVIKHLVKEGADFRNPGNKALQVAAAYGHLDVVKYLLETGTYNRSSIGPVILAVQNGHLDVVKYLVDKGAKLGEAVDGSSVLHAAELGRLEMVIYLKENGVDFKYEDNWPLRKAAEKGHVEVVKYLVEVGADIRAEGNEAIRNAAEKGHVEVVNYLNEVYQQQGIPLPSGI